MKYISILFLVLLLSLPVNAATVELSVDLSNKGPFSGQTNMGSFLTQAVKEYFNTDIAILCSSAIKGGTSKASLDSSSFSNFLYYPDDEIVIIELTGGQINKIIERSIRDYPKENSCFLQVSGIVGTFSKNGPPGSKILDLYIGGRPLDLSETYRVALDETLAGGFSGYITFTEGKNLENTNMTLIDTIEAYLQKHSIIKKLDPAGLKPI